MPSVDCGYDGDPFELVQTGPRLWVRIGFDPEYRSGGVAAISSELLPALIDTGADDCCIDVELATELKLPKVADRRTLGGVGGVGEFDFYLAQISVPDLGLTAYGQFAAVHIRSPYRALIGRTLLSRLILEYHGPTGAVVVRSP